MVKRYVANQKNYYLAESEAFQSVLKKIVPIVSPELLQAGLELGQILYELALDQETLTHAVLYPAVKANHIQLDIVAEYFGETSKKLLQDVIKLGGLSQLKSFSNTTIAQLENTRKMLLAMVSDVRAVLIILAERLCILRQCHTLSFAQETLDIYAPLANRLGISTVKWEMEDLCLRYLQPAIYKKIAKWLALRREEREIYIQNIITLLEKKLLKSGISSFTVTGRVKHIYSIYKKMMRKNNDLNKIYDISAVRVLVNTIADCYAVLSLIQITWVQIDQEFDDYIAHPKPNGYRSIHIAVIGPENRIIEIQIRTYDIHQESELGIAAHWRYKEGGVQKSAYENKIAWLRQVIEWQKELSDQAVISAKDLFAERIYVFTPNDDILDLPQGATPLDFAYYVHSAIGHRCRGAKVNGNIVPLTYQLQMGERVEILTTKHPNPSRDWLNLQAGYLKTSRARAKLNQWFKSTQISNEKFEKPEKPEKLEYAEQPCLVNKSRTKPLSANDIQIQGVNHVLTQIANCCKPLPGEAIIGYITHSKGVSIHRPSCHNILHIPAHAQNRLISVNWGETVKNAYAVDIKMTAEDRQGLLRDITACFATHKLNVLNIKTNLHQNSHFGHICITTETRNIVDLSRIMAELRQIPNVMQVWRDKPI